MYVTFFPAVLPDKAATGELGPKSVPSDIFIPLLEIARNPAPIEVLMKVPEQTNRTRFRKTILRPLLDAGFIEMTIPDKPRSSKQKYRLTEKGRSFVAKERPFFIRMKISLDYFSLWCIIVA